MTILLIYLMTMKVNMKKKITMDIYVDVLLTCQVGMNIRYNT